MADVVERWLRHQTPFTSAAPDVFVQLRLQGVPGNAIGEHPFCQRFQIELAPHRRKRGSCGLPVFGSSITAARPIRSRPRSAMTNLISSCGPQFGPGSASGFFLRLGRSGAFDVEG